MGDYRVDQSPTKSRDRNTRGFVSRVKLFHPTNYGNSSNYSSRNEHD